MGGVGFAESCGRTDQKVRRGCIYVAFMWKDNDIGVEDPLGHVKLQTIAVVKFDLLL